jgi:carboxylesterase type B
LNYTGQHENKLLPVMTFLYGGAFSQGSSDGPFGIYDSTYIAGTEEVVVVTVNYRLSGLGFFSAYNNATGTSISNAGLLDQQLALKWVQRNIAAFGGDPSNVMLYGESAGAMSTGLHATMPSSRGLFNRALLQSNPMGIFYVPQQAQELFGAEACRLSGCLRDGACDIPCMQAAPLAAVTDNLGAAIKNMTIYIEANLPHLLDGILGWKPTVDGVLVPSEPMTAFENGDFNRDVDYLVGTNTDESFPFVYGEGIAKLTYDQFSLLVSVLFGGDNGKVVADYYAPAYKAQDDGMAAAARAVTDWWFRCAVQKVPSAVKKYTDKSARVYRYNVVFSNPTLWTMFGFPPQCETGTCHASELIFTFAVFEKTLPNGLTIKMTPEEVALSKRMVKMWANFARSGDPNILSATSTEDEAAWAALSPRLREAFASLKPQAQAGPRWEEFDPKLRNNFVFNTAGDATEDAEELCTMWDKIGYHYDKQQAMVTLVKAFAEQNQ